MILTKPIARLKSHGNAGYHSVGGAFDAMVETNEFDNKLTAIAINGIRAMLSHPDCVKYHSKTRQITRFSGQPCL
jgi:hypothetical protein